jgi:outer membrane protein insertion porin family
VLLAPSVHAEISLPEITTSFNSIEELPAFMAAPEVLTTENSWDVQFPETEQVAPGEKLKIQIEIKQVITGNAKFVFTLNAKQKQEFKPVSANIYQTEIDVPAGLPLQEYQGEAAYWLDGKVIDTKTVYYEVARRLTEVVITGNYTIASAEVLSNILTQAGDFPNPVKMAADRQRLESLGYFESVEPRLEQKDKAYRLIFFLTENPIIKDIKIEGLSVFPKEKILSAFNLKVGEIYVAQTLQQDLKTMSDIYEQDGYFLYKLIDFDPPTTANGNVVTIKISEGRINQVTLAGNDNTKDYVVFREMKLKKGSVPNQNSLKKDLRKIFNLNYFSNVEPQLKPSQIDPNEVDLEIRVTEKKTSTLSLGIGYSEFTGTTGLIDLFLDNLWGTGQSVLLKTQFGGLYNSFQMRYSTPWIGDDPTSFTGRLWSTDQRNYITLDREWRSGFGVTFGRALDDYWRGSISLGAENIHMADIVSRNGVLNNSHDYATRTVGFGISYDTRDYIMNPHEGVFHAFNLTKAVTWFGGGCPNDSGYSMAVR